MNPTIIQDIKTVNCPKCIFCKTTTSKTAGDWGKNVWIKHYCNKHKQKVNHETTCKDFKKMNVCKFCGHYPCICNEQTI
jgi:hypothetical protein